MADWTQDQKEEVVRLYKEGEPTPENTIELINDIVQDHFPDKTVNGVRMILSKAGVYVAKAPATKSAKAAAGGDKPARVTKEESQQALTRAIEAAGHIADPEIISKLTGKAAIYFTGLFTNEE